MKPESKPEEQTVEEVFGEREKRASGPHKIKLTKRLVDGELLIEGFDHEGSCVYTKCVDAGEEISEQPLGKSEIVSQMLKTLSQVRASLTAEHVVLAEKAIRSLDIPCFLEIVRRVQVAA